MKEEMEIDLVVTECKSQNEKLKENEFLFFSPVRSVSLKVNNEIFSSISDNSGKLGIDELYINDHILKYAVYTGTDYIDGENGINNNNFDAETNKVIIFLNDVVKKAKDNYDEVVIERA